jgi:hypothetical protein
MTLFHVDQILDWFQQTSVRLRASGFEFAPERSISNESAFVDYFGSSATGRITGSVSGFFDFEIIANDDHRMLLFQHRHVSKLEDLGEIFSEFEAKLRGS